MCCSSAHFPIGDISEIDDLTEWFNNNPHLVEARNEMVRYKELPDQCGSCFKWKTQDVPMTRWVKRIVPWDDESFKNGEWPITFLEVTASNVCNQSCVMCNSFFSSKWVNVDKEALKQGMDFRENDRLPDGLRKYRLSDSDVDKLIGILPTVKTLVLKGGEPFADPANMRILEAASELENPPFVTIVTNGATLTERQFELLESYRGNIDIGLSYDGIHKQYEWVRSTPFEKTVAVANRLAEIKRNRPHQTNLTILKSVTLYTCFNLKEASEFWLEIPEINSVFIRPATRPPYASPVMLDPWQLASLQSDWLKLGENPRIEFHSTLLTLKSHFEEKPVLYRDNLKNVRRWIKFMNKQRGFDIQDFVPELEPFLCTLESK